MPQGAILSHAFLVQIGDKMNLRKIKNKYTPVVIGAVVSYLFLIKPSGRNHEDRKYFKKYLYAHRGLHDNSSDAPENSKEAFKRAVMEGYGVELDVQLSADKVPVVFHDETLERVCSVKGKVSDYTYNELKEFKLFNSEERIPRLRDVLKIIDGKVPLIVEIKMPNDDTSVCTITQPILDAYKGKYCVESFNPMAVFWYKKHKPDIFRGILSEDYNKSGTIGKPKLLYFFMHHLLFNFLIKPDFVAYNKKYYDDFSRLLCKKLFNNTAVAWTIKNQEELDRLEKEYDIFIFEGFIPR